MAQLVTRLDDRLVEQIDALVAAGVVASRRLVGMEIVDGYRRQPQTDEELAGIDDATRALIGEDAW